MKKNISLPAALLWTAVGIVTSLFWVVVILASAFTWAGFRIAGKDLRDYMHFQ